MLLAMLLLVFDSVFMRELLHGQNDLSAVVGGLALLGDLEDRRGSRNRQAREDRDDGDDDEQLDERESTPPGCPAVCVRFHGMFIYVLCYADTRPGWPCIHRHHIRKHFV